MRYLLHDDFLGSAKKYASKAAVIDEGGSSTTYKELASLSNKFGNFLNSCFPEDKKANSLIGILSSVRAESIAAILGILQIGFAYVPLDEFSPTNRLQKIIDSAGIKTVIVEAEQYERHRELLDSGLIEKVLLIGKADFVVSPNVITYDILLSSIDKDLPLLNQVSDDLAYVLHSSGSTGIPKGILLTHRNARTFTDWMSKEFEIVSDDVIASRAPFKFDLSVFDIFNTFKAGATLVCFDWNIKREGNNRHSDYVDLLSKYNVSVLYTTPSTFVSLMNRGKFGEADLNLRTIMYAGEPFPPAQLRKLMQVLPGTKVANIYGPTETNIITCYWLEDLPNADEPIPLGSVVDDTEIIVVNEEQNICQANELGELWCRGGTVTLGYLGMVEKTSQSLVDSPFHEYPVKFWKTGDFGFRDETGCLHYRGRKDHMVKVKGYRIELGEIERALGMMEGLDEFAVIAVPDEKYSNRIYCYYSLLDTSISSDDIRSFLSLEIAEYMLPYHYENLLSLPKTSSGKVDRVSLSALNFKKN